MNDYRLTCTVRHPQTADTTGTRSAGDYILLSPSESTEKAVSGVLQGPDGKEASPTDPLRKPCPKPWPVNKNRVSRQMVRKEYVHEDDRGQVKDQPETENGPARFAEKDRERERNFPQHHNGQGHGGGPAAHLR